MQGVNTGDSYLDCTELLGGGQGGCIGADDLWFAE